MTRALFLALIAGCGTSAPVCTTTMSGNVTETVSSNAACATLDATTLTISVTAKTSGLSLMISIDLGASPSAETYSSETVSTWSAFGSRATADGGECAYTAGSTAVPAGSFTLDLSAIDADAAHGTLDLSEFVQAPPGVDCGAGDDETIEIVF